MHIPIPFNFPARAIARRRSTMVYDVREAIEGVRFRVKEQTEAVFFEAPQQMPARALPRWILRSKSCTARLFGRYYSWAQKRWIDEALLLILVAVVIGLLAALHWVIGGFFDAARADAIRYYTLQLWWARIALERAVSGGCDPQLPLAVGVTIYTRGNLIHGKAAFWEGR